MDKYASKKKIRIGKAGDRATGRKSDGGQT
jgi:hypothetical protein